MNGRVDAMATLKEPSTKSSCVVRSTSPLQANSHSGPTIVHRLTLGIIHVDPHWFINHNEVAMTRGGGHMV